MKCAYGFATTDLYLNSQLALQNSNDRISKTCVLRVTFHWFNGYRRCINCNKGDNGHYVINSKRFPEERAPNSVYVRFTASESSHADSSTDMNSKLNDIDPDWYSEMLL